MAQRLRFIGTSAFIALIVLFALASSVSAAPARQDTPSVDVDNQSITNGTVVVAEATAAQDGWMVIHIDQNGNPGPVIGHTAVKKGENYKVAVKLERDVPAGTKLWAMLHIDAGKIGTYEFPGPDAPVVVNNDIVMKDFTTNTASGNPAAQPPAATEEANAGPASLDVDNQALTNGSVVVAETNATQDGWMVIHVDQNGNPGPVIGHTAVKKGETYKVAVKLEQNVAPGAKLWAMLHIDAGKIGVYEFPGPDAPVVVNNDIVMKPLTITAASQGAPAGLPSTGGEETPYELALLGALLILLAGVLLKLRFRM
jgi:LPXTG-motif cell wall-anchored protein